MSLSMVVGTMIGSGIYLLPAVLAPFGPNMPAAWAVTIAGTMCIAYSLARLAMNMAGGPTSYITAAFGDLPAFVTMWSYLVSVWSGLAAVALATAGALSYVVTATGTGAGLLTVAGGSILILAIINLSGVRNAGGLQIATTLIKIVPLAIVLVLAAERFGQGQPLEQLAPVPLGTAGILGAAALTLFSLTGFEVGAIAAPVTEDAKRNVPRAQIIGVGITAAIYLLSTLAVLWILPSPVAGQSKAPFADAIAPVLGSGAGTMVAIIAAISAFGANNAVLLSATEAMRSLAEQGDLPPAFARTNGKGVPYFALATAALVGIALLIFSSAPGFVSVYAFVALVSAVATLVLYAMCSAAVLKLRFAGGIFGIGIAIAAVLYSIAMFFGAGWEATLWGSVLALVGLPLRWLTRKFWPNPEQEARAGALQGSTA